MTTPLKEAAEVLDTVRSRRLSVLVRMRPRVERNLARPGQLDHVHRGRPAALQAGPVCPILDRSRIPDGRWPSPKSACSIPADPGSATVACSLACRLDR